MGSEYAFSDAIIKWEASLDRNLFDTGIEFSFCASIIINFTELLCKIAGLNIH